MIKHFKYFWYLMKHKWFVLIATHKIGHIYPNGWQVFVHDFSKFLPSEWFPYVNYFFDNSLRLESSKEKIFNKAFQLHISRNPHHWEYWVKNKKCKEIPEKYLYELLTDWMASGRAKNGYWDIKDWYNYNKRKIRLHKKTRILIEKIINNLDI